MPEEAVPRSDDDLAAAARDGDLDSFNELVRRYERRVYGLCRGMLRSPAAAEDAAQDTMLSAWRGLAGYRGGSFGPWLLRIAGNRCRDELRRRKRRPSTSLDELVEEHGDAFSPPDEARTPEAAALDSETGRALLRALDRLPDEQRQAVILSDVQGLHYEEIARAMGTTAGTVKSRLSRGRARMRQLLIDSGELSEARRRLALRERERAGTSSGDSEGSVARS